ncbi:rhodanese-like domain-containing protein [Rhodococcus sp. X156]|uniref:rhodanese-like domain-containing protein n=1 Tax=Rhodococcus sp. X156 TaxID=2499145 RepID=UPI000FD7105B|nr:rhodanese-like domain-containing protein [Rhodococcus sp. X156]
MSAPQGRPAEGYTGDLTVQEAWEAVAGGAAVLVDVRTDAEWRYVGVPDLSDLQAELGLVEWVSAQGEVNPEFTDEVDRLAQGRPVMFLCRSGQRSVSAARAVTAAGRGPAYNVLDGFEGGLDSSGHRGSTGWRAEGLPWRQS